jgi:uncharacterized membrane protein YecN with MAPEG domain
LFITPLYAAALAILFLVLSVRVIVKRRISDVGFGAPPDSDLERCVRVHANFAEYVPLALLLLAMAESRGAQPLWLHIGGVCLVIGRIAHALGVSRPRTDDIGRIVGMTGSQTAILIGAVLIFATIRS